MPIAEAMIPNATGDEGEHDHAAKREALGGEGVLVCCEEPGGQDHGADILCGCGFEEVGTAAGAIADIVADEVCDDGGIAGIIFRNSCFDFADEICADIRCLGVDTATQLCEQRNEAGAKAITHDEQGDFLDIMGYARRLDDREEACDTQQAQCDNKEP